MDTLLIRLGGPMQSWGIQSRFGVRDTGLEPSKSGVIGLLCAALGRPRDAHILDLAPFKLGIRVDCEGAISMDFHTAQNIIKSGGGIKDTDISRRYYLCDARFLVGLEGSDTDLLTQLHYALQYPVWLLYLGRKAFVPAEPIWLPDGLHHNQSLVEALTSHPWKGRSDDHPPHLRLIIEDPQNGSEVRHDQPLSFAERRFAPRRVRTDWITMEDHLCTYLD